MSNNELQKPIFPLASVQKTPAKTAVGFSDPTKNEKLRSLCKLGENYGLLMGKNTGLFCLDFDLYKSGKKSLLSTFFTLGFVLFFHAFSCGVCHGNPKSVKILLPLGPSLLPCFC